MSEHNEVLQAVLLSTTPPTGEQERRFCELLRARYGREIAHAPSSLEPKYRT